MNKDIFAQVREIIENNDVVLFMKGTAGAPMCGFSGLVVQVLNKLRVEFIDINILEDQDLRQRIKDFSDWPTIPQLYIKGEFIGGCDIVKELYQSGELIDILKRNEIRYN
ncbi:MAG: Grx4 family monothiol glutaredoxin [Candidatus Midichloria mitochondrii]|uniref:Glutaredoxin n=1 Tax=Midichloria mitochondrii (strain IricVA) TaxID=696127 RepID=F7XUV2_MIDMI|nr:Grx4 family monothiol glutaredoxin [Candidatus Midichloria mitochondrii]AEI88451.1 glutaredoxin-like protein [Candidatus Midichloria mitochondrii IricVA]MDJ1256207.1 Grx4 family monothiol glutaredoxin [Candidatus Midichloria mitochondrii]MDJ1287881.1 Grx4 family monothiol glutaredoxin [Candidatus Midichloria mitochondrii]MDJ1298769.1 Grx4 family monothiol glutaredoxin [Candidatus Midichloria mitochondrii]MDJ1312923.1 Grx4 family monothiol glutaredoxin [Candidatus Midichloria mitochondrii]